MQKKYNHDSKKKKEITERKKCMKSDKTII